MSNLGRAFWEGQLALYLYPRGATAHMLECVCAPSRTCLSLRQAPLRAHSRTFLSLPSHVLAEHRHWWRAGCSPCMLVTNVTACGLLIRPQMAAPKSPLPAPQPPGSRP